jgi:signal transduction histidine kinase
VKRSAISRAGENASRGKSRTAMHNFLATHRNEIIARTRAKVAQRVAPRPTTIELDEGIPLFLDQLIATLRNPSPSDDTEISRVALQHGGNLLQMGFTVGQVVHDYGGLCQAITELAVDLEAPITSADFHTLNRCLDDAIAEAVTEYSRQREQVVSDNAIERLGFFAHELRNALNTGILAFEVLKSGRVGATGSTSALVDHSFSRMRDLVDRSLAEVRLQAGLVRREPVVVAALIEEVSIVAALEATDYGVQLTVEPVEYGVLVQIDGQILAAALVNLLQNAFKFTRPNSQVSLHTHISADRVRIEVSDECGGLPPGKTEDLFRAFEQRGADRTGLGLGLTISRRCVEQNGGELRVRNIPGTGCIFTVDLPRHLGSA